MKNSNFVFQLLWLLLCQAAAIWGQWNMSSVLQPQAERVMALSEWEERWQEGKIGFHQPHVNK